MKPALHALGLEKDFAAVVAAEDTYRGRPDPEPYLLAAQLMGRPPARCVVVGNSNQVRALDLCESVFAPKMGIASLTQCGSRS